jgi:histone H3/H4
MMDDSLIEVGAPIDVINKYTSTSGGSSANKMMNIDDEVMEEDNYKIHIPESNPQTDGVGFISKIVGEGVNEGHNNQDEEDEVNAENAENAEPGKESHKKGNYIVNIERGGLIRFPMAKIKKIMKLNPGIGICQKNSYIVIGKLAELFIQELARNAASVAKINKRKTMNIEDICK